MPGQTVTIPATVTPGAAPGSTVRGTLYVDGASYVSGDVAFNLLPGPLPGASEVAALPYTYTVG